MDRASQADPLVVLIDLEKRVRSVLTLDELYFVFVNETHGLVPYRQAILFGRDGAPLTVSGVADLEHCLLYTSPSPRDLSTSRMPSSA